MNAQNYIHVRCHCLCHEITALRDCVSLEQVGKKICHANTNMLFSFNWHTYPLSQRHSNSPLPPPCGLAELSGLGITSSSGMSFPIRVMSFPRQCTCSRVGRGKLGLPCPQQRAARAEWLGFQPFPPSATHQQPMAVHNATESVTEFMDGSKPYRLSLYSLFSLQKDYRAKILACNGLCVYGQLCCKAWGTQAFHCALPRL